MFLNAMDGKPGWLTWGLDLRMYRVAIDGEFLSCLSYLKLCDSRALWRWVVCDPSVISWDVFYCPSYLNLEYIISLLSVDTVCGLEPLKWWWWLGCILFHWALSTFNCNIEQIYWPVETTEGRDKQFTKIQTDLTRLN